MIRLILIAAAVAFGITACAGASVDGGAGSNGGNGRVKIGIPF